MVIIQLQGGLGNQMFQYAAGKSLAKYYKNKLLTDVSFITSNTVKKDGFTPREYALSVFKNIDSTLASKKKVDSFLNESKKNKSLNKLGLPFKKTYTESSFAFDANFFLQKPPVLLNGYFQSEKYFTSIADTIRQQFSFSPLQGNDKNIPIVNHIKKNRAISVHVRRDDYVNDTITSSVHGACSVEYYTNAFAYMQRQFPDAAFIFFSDEPSWAHDKFVQHLPGSMVVQNNDGADSWKDMYLMSQCNHHIIANSSFSWWGAWLNHKKDKKVIAPKQWFADAAKNNLTTDLIPANWIRL